MSDVQIIALFVIVSGAAGALVGLLVAASLAARIVKHWLPDFPEFIAVKAVNLTTTITDDEEALTSRTSVIWSANEVTSKFVEKWLESRHLVMSPKGKDFAVPVKTKKGGA